MLLDNQVMVVTGAASPRGIGRAAAALMLEFGARVAIVDTNKKWLDQTCAELGEKVAGYACDVTDWSATQRCFENIVNDLGVPSALVNNAGITQPKRLLEIEEADLDAVMAVSVKGTFFCSKAVVPFMKRNGRGSIVNMSSVSAERGGGIFGGPHYSAAKAGVLGLTRAMARDHGQDQIRVNAVAPGFIETDITGGRLTGEQHQDIVDSIPLGRTGQPLDVARICVFLASDLAGYVTGAVIDVNGGMHIG